MLCGNCGKEIENTAANCPCCGKKIATGNGRKKEFGSVMLNLLNIIGTAIFVTLAGFSVYYFESVHRSLGLTEGNEGTISEFLMKGRLLLIVGFVLVVILIIANVKEMKK